MSPIDIIKSQMPRFDRDRADRLQPSINRLTAIAHYGYKFAAGHTQGQAITAMRVTEMLIPRRRQLRFEQAAVTLLHSVSSYEELQKLKGDWIISNIESLYSSHAYLDMKPLWKEFGQDAYGNFSRAVRATAGDNLARTGWEYRMGAICLEDMLWSTLWTSFHHEIAMTMSYYSERADNVRDYIEVLCSGFFAHGVGDQKTPTLLAFTA